MPRVPGNGTLIEMLLNNNIILPNPAMKTHIELHTTDNKIIIIDHTIPNSSLFNGVILTRVFRLRH